jgi:ribosomal RNA-processing protein 8
MKLTTDALEELKQESKDAQEELKQESKDAKKLGHLKDGSGRCPNEVLVYLDKNLPGWRTKVDFDKKAMEDAVRIVERAKARELIGKRLLPRNGMKLTTDALEELKQESKDALEELKQESKDAKKLGHLKDGSGRCPNEVLVYLDKNLPGWRYELDTRAIEDAKQIVKRANERKKNKQNVIPRRIQKKDRNTKELEQEDKDATKCGYWKKILFDKAPGRCSDDVRYILDKGLPGWSNKVDLDKNAIEAAEQIVKRANERKKNKQNVIPRRIQKKDRNNNREPTSSELQESKDACKVGSFKKALKNGKGSGNKCCDAVRDILDKGLPGWRPIDVDTPPKPKKIIKKKLIIIEESSIADTSKPKPKKSMKKKLIIIEESEPPCISAEPTEHHKRERVESELSVLHKRYKKLTSQNLRKEFTENPDLWTKYHEIAEENEKSFPEDGIPRNRIIAELNKIHTTRTKSVVDMGCGKAQIAEHYKNDTRFKFFNYDHVSSNDAVTSCDISRTPLDDNSVEICILSLAMWGFNCEGYITEASRILESNGELYIIEPTKRKRWSEYDEHGNIVQGKEGDKLKELLETNGFHIKKPYVKKPYIEKFCLFVCTKSA